jgi:AI-2 transport protein TqsA
MNSQTARNALVVLAVVVGGAALYWLREILAPLALACFLLIMIDGMARLFRRYIPAAPGWAGMAAAISLIGIAFVLSVFILVDGIKGFKDELPLIHGRINVIIAEVAGGLNLKVAPTADDLMTHLDPQKYVGSVATGVQGVASSAFFVLIYVGFLLASRGAVAAKISALFPTATDRVEAEHIFERIRTGVESYVWVQTVLGLLIAILAWGVMAAIGLHNAPFWAFVIFVTGYIPIVGGAIAIIAPPLFALVEFTTYWQAIALFAALEVILFVVGNVLLPRMQAKSMNIDPIVVLLSLAFWGALWGVSGAFLSTPLTVAVMAVLAEFKGGRWMAVLLSGDGKPYPMEPPEPDPATDPEPEVATGRKPRAKTVSGRSKSS